MAVKGAKAGSGSWWKKVKKAASTGSRVKPAFSRSWVLDTPTGKILDSRENRFVRTTLIKEGSDKVYCIDPYEYRMSKKEISPVISAMEGLKEIPPPQAILDDEIRLRKHLEKSTLRYFTELPHEMGSDAPPLLGRITAQYTAGYGVIEHLLRDERVQDIYIDSPPELKPVYVSLGGHIPRGLEGIYPTNIYLTEKELQRIVSILRYHSGLPFSESSPILECDLALYNARVTAVGPPLSQKGISIAIRKHSHDPWTLLRLIDVSAITPMASAFLSMSIAGRRTMLIAGPRGAGKTSLLTSLLFEVDRSQRMIIIEDTPELPIISLNNNGYKVLGLTVDGEGGITVDKALRTALRLGESVLVLGEVRGPETKTLYEMMSAGTAGSSVLGTFHADSAEAVYKRAVEDLGVSKISFAATDLVIVAGLVQPKGRKERLRRVVQIAELIKDGPPGRFRDLFTYDRNTGLLEPTESLDSSSTLKAIAKLWGISPYEALHEMKVRDSILRKAGRILEPQEISRPETMSRVNEAYQVAREESLEKDLFKDQKFILKRWKRAFEEEIS